MTVVIGPCHAGELFIVPALPPSDCLKVMNKKFKRTTRRFEEQLRITTARKRVCDTIDLIRAEQSAGDMQPAYELLVGMEEAVMASRSLGFLRAYRPLVVVWSLCEAP